LNKVQQFSAGTVKKRSTPRKKYPDIGKKWRDLLYHTEKSVQFPISISEMYIDRTAYLPIVGLKKK